MFTPSLETGLLRRGNLQRGEEILLDVVTGTVRSATTRMRSGGRRQIERSGLGPRLAKALRGKVTSADGVDITKKGRDANPTGYVWSKAIVKRGGPPTDLLETFETGATIQAKGGTYLEVPAKSHPQGRKAKPSSSLAAGTFRVIPVGGAKKRGRPAANRVAFVLVHRRTNVVWYLWFKSVRLKKRIRLLPLAARLQAGMPADMRRRAVRAEKRIEALL